MNKNDEYFLLADFESYANAQRHVVELYQDRAKWARICLVNIAKSGFFSSDRTIEQYVEDIWHIKKCKFFVIVYKYISKYTKYIDTCLNQQYIIR